MKRMLSVISALALACMCLAFPVAAAPPDDHLHFDVVTLGVVAEPAFDLTVAVTMMLPDLALSPSAVANVQPNCSDHHVSMSTVQPDGSVVAVRLPSCTRHYDPGWRAG